jgi:UV DNA damage endonuclease
MLECKDKEQAVLYIYRLYELKEVNYRSLRPPATEESLRTKGRKSAKKGKGNSKKKGKQAEEGEEGGEQVGGDIDGEVGDFGDGVGEEAEEV